MEKKTKLWCLTWKKTKISGVKDKPQKIIPKKKIHSLPHDPIPKIQKIKIKSLKEGCLNLKNKTKKKWLFKKGCENWKEKETDKLLAWWISASSSLRDSLKDLPMEEPPPPMYIFQMIKSKYTFFSIKNQQQQVS